MPSKEELGKCLGATEGSRRRRPSRVNWQALGTQEASRVFRGIVNRRRSTFGNSSSCCTVEFEFERQCLMLWALALSRILGFGGTWRFAGKRRTRNPAGYARVRATCCEFEFQRRNQKLDKDQVVNEYKYTLLTLCLPRLLLRLTLREGP